MKKIFFIANFLSMGILQAGTAAQAALIIDWLHSDNGSLQQLIDKDIDINAPMNENQDTLFMLLIRSYFERITPLIINCSSLEMRSLLLMCTLEFVACCALFIQPKFYPLCIASGLFTYVFGIFLAYPRDFTWTGGWGKYLHQKSALLRQALAVKELDMLKVNKDGKTARDLVLDYQVFFRYYFKKLSLSYRGAKKLDAFFNILLKDLEALEVAQYFVTR